MASRRSPGRPVSRGWRARPDVPAQANDTRLGLTKREYEVLGVLAAGRTNRQIANELFISEKTVSIHVSRILATLGVASRGEAAALARQRGVPEHH